MKICSVYASILTLMLALILMLVSCGDLETENSEKTEDYHSVNIDEYIEYAIEAPITHIFENHSTYIEHENNSTIIGDYKYPENPAEQLRNALIYDITTRGLPLAVGDIEIIVFESQVYAQIKIDFTNSGNTCVIMFPNKHYDFSDMNNGLERQSFTMAFQDHENTQDMITVLTMVIRYLSPSLSLEEAERLAIMQDKTISTDGFSMPLDIGGYQIQTRYTNPHVFFRTPYFEAKLGVKVRAIRHLWQGAIDTSNFYRLTNREDYNLLNLYSWNEYHQFVYGDFIIENTWQQLCWRHGCTSVVVDVVSMYGERFSLNIDTLVFTDTYEFGVGQQYTLFIDLQFYPEIVYAVQRSKSEHFNMRGEMQPIDYLSLEFVYSKIWFEPDLDEVIHEVIFETESFGLLNFFSALDGYGVAAGQWFDPIRDYYAFLGWFDNEDFEGFPLTSDTPIFQDTTFYPKWGYIGSGGVWPRAYRGVIHGLDEGSIFVLGQNLTITAIGYNMNLESPRDQRFRWRPVSWNLSSGESGIFTVPFQTNIPFDSIGEHWLYITYQEEIFDGRIWQETNQLRKVRERLLFVVNE